MQGSRSASGGGAAAADACYTMDPRARLHFNWTPLRCKQRLSGYRAWVWRAHAARRVCTSAHCDRSPAQDAIRARPSSAKRPAFMVTARRAEGEAVPVAGSAALPQHQLISLVAG